MKRILGIDFGKIRIGLAISDELQLLAHPLETISAKNAAVRRIAQIVSERDIERVIVGLPRHMSGDTGRSAEEATKLVDALRAILPCEVLTWDERLTTVAAERMLHEAGRNTRQSRQ